MSSNRQWLYVSDAGWKLEFADGSTTALAPVVAPRVSTLGLVAHFDGTDSFSLNGRITGWSWDFGDGNRASSSTATHTYLAEGNYTATLSVTDSAGQTASRSIDVPLSGSSTNLAPLPSFTASVSGATVTADASASSDPDGFITSYVWDFGDGRAATGKTVSHTYTVAGVYVVQLTVLDNKGAGASIAKQITVTSGPVTPNVGPTAKFTVSVPTTAGVTTFNASTSSDPDGVIASYAWDFGDGVTGSGVSTSHTYKASGTYQARLTVTDDDGATGQASATVSVSLSNSGGGTEPSGAGIVSYSTLSGPDFGSRVNSAPDTSMVSLPPGTFTFSDFKDDTASHDGALILQPGLLGSGPKYTIVSLVPGSSHYPGYDTASPATFQPPTSGTNSLYLVAANYATAQRVEGIHFKGTNEGHDYNGLRIKSASPTLKNVKVSAVPGSDTGPPGETFYVNFTASNPSTTNLECDGASVGSSGLAFNSSSGGLTTNYYGHDMEYCKTVAMWKHAGGHTFNDAISVNSTIGLGFEECTGTYTLNRPTFGGEHADIHLAASGKVAPPAKLVINDPILIGQTQITIWVPITYNGNPAYPGVPNVQKLSDVTVFVGGVNKTSTLLKSVTPTWGPNGKYQRTKVSFSPPAPFNTW